MIGSLICGVGLIIIVIIFKCITSGFLIGGELSRRKGEKDNKIATKKAENEIIQQMNKFSENTNYYKEKNKKLQEKALQEAQYAQKQDDAVVQNLKNALIYLKCSFPLADNELFKKYSQAFFMQKVEAIKKIEKDIERSHNQKIQQS